MMHLDDILPGWLLGTLEPEERRAAERHLAVCGECRADAERLRPAVDALGVSVVPVAPPSGGLARLMGVMEGPERLARFAEPVATLFDVTRERAVALLASLGGPEAWLPGPVSGVELAPVEPGPGRVGMMAAFVRLRPGARYPRHTHLGREWNLVLEGGLREQDGREVWPGEALDKAEGSSHDFTALMGPACIAATVLDGVVEFESEPSPAP
ncbi:transcriptional regulator [Corallococcus sp. H22C18031201]|uniref:cupin domain-containing protein n=1 Tax=Citreicoccus inhibens TaxID=2849499 RepID=UPI000E73B524|nr:cupin domain-containing protein [Citreicoccus inhibens]MBU8899707.1 cupin domain-containing protein [Citreicoccus inhibens]RJS18371.1 transcriptional regulator [Corallococcus sp. H22C18031201]